MYLQTSMVSGSSLHGEWLSNNNYDDNNNLFLIYIPYLPSRSYLRTYHSKFCPRQNMLWIHCVWSILIRTHLNKLCLILNGHFIKIMTLSKLIINISNKFCMQIFGYSDWAVGRAEYIIRIYVEIYDWLNSMWLTAHARCTVIVLCTWNNSFTGQSINLT